MYEHPLELLIHRLKQALRLKRRLTVEETAQLLQLWEAIIAYGRMIMQHYGSVPPYVIVEVEEIATRFRETQLTIEKALLLLRDRGYAEPFHKGWKL